MAYTDFTALKVYLKIPVATSADDALLTALIARAQAAIDNFCRQTFEAAADSTRYFDPTRDVNGRTLYLDAPLAAITTVTNGNSVVVTSSQYIAEPRNTTPWNSLVLKTNAGIAWTYTGTPENAISILGRWAYSTSAPADIVQATTRLAAYLFRQRDNAVDLDRAVIAGNATILPAQLPRDIETFLFKGGYRRLVL
jgi:hypothetical protein